METLTEAQFEEKFAPYVREDGDLFEFEDVCDKPLELVWTIVDTPENHWVAIPGFHIVNRLGYCLGKFPWTDAEQDGYWYYNDDPVDDEEQI